LLAVQILSVNDKVIREKMISYKAKLTADVMKKIERVEKSFN